MERYFAALAATGDIDTACQVAAISRRTIEYSRQRGNLSLDSGSFREREALAKRQFGEKVLRKATTAVLNASDDRLLDRPTLAIFAANAFLPEIRPSGSGTVQVAVQVNLTEKLSSSRLEEIAGQCEASE